jgi:putative ABC transport system permease protein
MMRILRLSLRFVRREWRSGELTTAGLALVVAVASVSAVGFFTDRVRGAMSQQASELLAADMLVVSSSPIPAAWINRASKSGLDTALATQFPSVVLVGNKTLLAEVKAVTSTYPLRGEVRVAPRPYAPDAPTDAIPASGEAWLDARLMAQLGIEPGTTVSVGASKLRATQVIAYEPDRGGDMFSIAPRLMMNAQDIPATRLIQIGSRISYRLLVAGAADSISAYRAWLKPELPASAQIQGVRDSRPEMRVALDRAEQFLSLAALVSVVLAGVAIAISGRRYAMRHLDTSALLRCFGASQRTIVGLYTAQLVLLAVVGSLIGVLVGFLAQWGLASILVGLFADQLPPPSATPVLTGLATGLIVLLGFALPPILHLKNVPPARVLRRDVGNLPASSTSIYVTAVVAMFGLMFWQTKDPALTLYVSGGSLATLIALGLVAWLLTLAVGRLRTRVGVAWRFGIANISRRARSSIVQLVAFGLGIMVMLLLAIVRNDLINQWQDSLPPDAPNYFLINVQSQQVDELNQFFQANGVRAPALYPMTRARLTGINNKPLDPDSFEDERARRLATREQNLSAAATPQADNRLLAGRWWSSAEHGQPLMSLEEGIATRLGIKLGDTLQFNIVGEPISFTVSSLRSVDWDSFQVNFFMVVPPGVLDDFPANYITSFHLPPSRPELLGNMIQRFPNLTVLDITALMGKVRNIMDRVTLAVEFVFLFTLIAGLLVLWAAIQSTQDERLYEGAILRTLGASRRQLLLGVAAEFITLGVLAGLLAAFSSSLIGYVLAEQIFHLPYKPNLAIWLAGLVGGALGVGITGTLGARSVITHPPLYTLRRA